MIKDLALKENIFSMTILCNFLTHNGKKSGKILTKSYFEQFWPPNPYFIALKILNIIAIINQLSFLPKQKNPMYLNVI